jgi:hypothetical protein
MGTREKERLGKESVTERSLDRQHVSVKDFGSERIGAGAVICARIVIRSLRTLFFKPFRCISEQRSNEKSTSRRVFSPKRVVPEPTFTKYLNIKLIHLMSDKI